MSTDSQLSTGDTLTDRDIAALRAVDARARERMPLEEAAAGLAPVLFDIARRNGVSLPERTVFRCAGRCNLEVQRRGSYCDICASLACQRQRAAALRTAYESVARAGGSVSLDDSLEWCRVRSEEYSAATAKARAIAAGLANSEHALLVLGLGRWSRDSGNLLLLGPKRLGKTKAAVGIAHRILDKALCGDVDTRAFRFACGIRFVSGIKIGRARAETRLGSTPEIVSIAERASLLILDEVGYEEDPTAIRDVIYDRCEDPGRPTLITSARTLVELEVMYGATAIDRLTERSAKGHPRGFLIDLHPRAAKMAKAS